MIEGIRENVATSEGRALGKELARLCDTRFDGKPDLRCHTCAFRSGEHLANGSVDTLMSALKCAMEGDPFWCHEEDKACSGWAAFCFPPEKRVVALWDHAKGAES
jgi:hypothetical protein